MLDYTRQPFMDETFENPFLEDIFVDHPANLPVVGRIHHEVFGEVLAVVEGLVRMEEEGGSSGMGRLFLVTAPEAGYGKSHLVGRLRDHLGAVVTTLVLPFDRSRPATWPVALSSVLRQFSLPSRVGRSGITLIEEFSRRFLSRLVLENLASGAVTPRDCPEEAGAIASDYLALLGPESQSKLLAWIDKRSPELVRLARPPFSRRLGLGPAELGFWTRVLVDVNRREESALERLRGLSNGEARERLVQFLRIATDHRPAMLVADGLDGFFHSGTAGMEIAEILNGIREKVPRSLALVCLNDDVWSSVFESRLPSAWRDRFDGEASRLRCIEPEEAADLVRLRLRRTRLTAEAVERFVGRLGDERLWIDSETKLSPRRVLRQAGELWKREARSYLAEAVAPEEDEDLAATTEETLENLTDKAAILDALETEAEEAEEAEEEAARPAAPLASQGGDRPGGASAKPAPPPLAASAPSGFPGQNPFEEAPSRLGDAELAGIDSIINDIRGSGKTVVSEAPERPSVSTGDPVQSCDPRPVTETPPRVEVPPLAPAGPTPARPPATSRGFVEPRPRSETVKIPASFFEGFATAAPAKTMERPAPLTRASIEEGLARRETEFLSGGPALVLDLDRIGGFIRSIGRQHAALAQQEERFPSSRTVCLRWSVRGHSTLIGFESPKNVYFWNNLLQQSLASNRVEKIVAFSHASEPFDPALFASFGFGPAVIKGRIDVIAMSDRELAMIYAAEITMRGYAGTGEAEKAAQLVTLHLDPLWRRVIQPV